MNGARPPDGPVVGAPLDRLDGPLKVTGGARYAAEMPVAGLAHAVLVTSTVARGRVARVDARAAEAAPGVLAVLTPMNAPTLPGVPAPHTQEAGGTGTGEGGAGGEGQGGQPAQSPNPPQISQRIPTLLQDDRVYYNGQPIGVVVADTLERAAAAVGLVRVTYAAEPPDLDVATAPRAPDDRVKVTGGPRATRRGDVAAGLAAAAARVDQRYTTPHETHNPMEPHATTAVWEADGADPHGRLTLYTSTQAVFGVRDAVARIFGLPPDRVRVVAPFTGGGFGGKGGAWSHEALAAMAARRVGRAVKLVLTRWQMFGPVGGRPHTDQRVTVGAARDGALTAVRHDVLSTTSQLEDWTESSALATRSLYACPNVETSHALARLNEGTPTYMRAPGESTGLFALESALDELAVALGMDPLALRVRNYAERDPEAEKPWSSNGLRECYARGAERFGWARRPPAPRAMADGRWLVGWGMATATRPAKRAPASTTVRVAADGRARVEVGTQEIGTGTYTILAQLAADALGVPVDRVEVALGDTRLPEAPASVGSRTAASAGTAVHEAATAARQRLVATAVGDPASPLYGAPPAAVGVRDGRMLLATDLRRGETYAALLARHGGAPIAGHADARPAPDEQGYTAHAFGAVFVEVRVDRDLGEVRVPRVVGVYDIGRVLNRKTAASQMIGSVVWGIGMALAERTVIDPRLGRYVNADLAEYHVPVCADVGTIDVDFVDPRDAHVNPIGVKGGGEVALTGTPAAIANAVWHATGRRIRALPITPDTLL
ncbi:carbon-monoxide dehydrogenase large subunit [Gemmatimonadetes bacterium T265]|nr:carbon-monoxide dehydrogenase large subunit [Gemmatimonadetes bacterium T265]